MFFQNPFFGINRPIKTSKREVRGNVSVTDSVCNRNFCRALGNVDGRFCVSGCVEIEKVMGEPPDVF